jgi:hypothetical protein
VGSTFTQISDIAPATTAAAESAASTLAVVSV